MTTKKRSRADKQNFAKAAAKFSSTDGPVRLRTVKSRNPRFPGNEYIVDFPPYNKAKGSTRTGRGKGPK